MRKNLTESPEWQSLQTHYDTLTVNERLKKERAVFSMNMEALNLSCFYPHVTEETQKKLIQLARASRLSEQIENLFQGKSVNVSENLPALHTAMREVNPSSDVQENLNKMREISDKIRQKRWLGYTGKPIQNILHIGIGGSDLSQRLTCHALEKYADTDITIQYTANIDPDDMESALKKSNPETTLIIIASKSFSTLETQMNTDRAMEWLQQSAGKQNLFSVIQQQVIAITAYPDKIIQRYPVARENILLIPLGIGGRYSIWSAMGLVLAIAVGFDHFKLFLAGAHSMDRHFRETPFEKNMPVMLALMGIWNINFFHCQTQGIIPYSERLFYLPAHLQQLDMESNGKSITISGEKVDYATGPVVWGGIGCNSQHSFHQLLHQGTHLVPIDFIMIQPSNENMKKDPRLLCLNSNCKAQVQTLSEKKSCFVNLIVLNDLTPYTLGSLMAFYEHKIFVQSQIWNINPFDQPGVEEAKLRAREMIKT